MKQSPIIFSTEMVKAILDGRKTQTRRIFKDHPRLSSDISKIDLKQWLKDYPDLILGYSPFGKTGDLLWVRETFCPMVISDYDGEGNDKYTYLYKTEPNCNNILSLMEDATWKPSIFMPKKAARIWLKVTNIRIERLQDISKKDVIAEGIIKSPRYLEPSNIWPAWRTENSPGNAIMVWFKTPIDAFKNLWEAINGEDSWKKNPWVWVIEFERIEKPSLNFTLSEVEV